MKIGFSSFFIKTETHLGIPPEYLLSEITSNFSRFKKGYRDGVILVPISPVGFSCPIANLHEGDYLVGNFTSRVPGEEPRKKYFAPNKTPRPANFVDVVLYSREVLAETGEGSKDVDWEIITILSKVDENQPMPPATLCYNFFKLSGGTSTNMTNDEFVAAMKESFIYWKDKALIE